MNALARAVFMLLLCATITAQAVQIRRTSGARPAAAVTAATLARIGATGEPSADESAWTVRLPNCSDPVLLTLIDLDGRTSAEQGPHDARPLFVYLGTAAPDLDYHRFRLRWVVANIRFILGLRSEIPDPRVLRLDMPGACRNADPAALTGLSTW